LSLAGHKAGSNYEQRQIKEGPGQGYFSFLSKFLLIINVLQGCLKKRRLIIWPGEVVSAIFALRKSK
jgi:hypothetical protein